jgi:hypothetical protein
MTTERRNWREALNPQERSALRALDRQIKLQEEVAELRSRSIQAQRELVFLRYQRQVIQNRVTQRARRSVLEMAAS